MTIELRDAVNGDGLFDILGKAFYALSVLNTARGTTVPTEVEDAITQFKNLAGSDLDYEAAFAGLPSATVSWQSNASVLADQIRSNCSNLLCEFVKSDLSRASATEAFALQELIDQMENSASYVDSNAIAASLATGTSNVGDVAVCYTTRRGDGRDCENALGETITITVTSASATSPTLSFAGRPAETTKLSHLWPKGSGCNISVTAADPASSLLSNGDFEDTTIANLPDDWIVTVGILGDTVEVTAPGQQTVRISGTPTGGYYVLYYTNVSGVKRATAALAYNASASTLQTELRKLPGLEQATVSATGTSPNYTHTIVFTGLAGEVTALSSSNFLTGGTSPTITHSVLQAGTNGAYKGRALKLAGHGAEYLTLYHPLTVTADTVYFCHLRMRREEGEEQSSSSSSSSSLSLSSSSSGSVSSSSSSSGSSSSSQTTSSQSLSSQTTSSSSSLSSSSLSSSSQTTSSSSSSSSSSGSSSSLSSSSQSASESSESSSSSSQSAEELRLAIVSAIDGTTTMDDDGNENELRITGSDLSTAAHTSHWFSFRVAKTYTQPVYLKIAITAPFASDTNLYLDECAIVKGTELYAGGPWVAAFAGATAAVLEDEWTLTVTNDRAGSFQEWFNRVFDTAGKGLLLPSSGTTNVPDSLIA